MLPLAPAWVGLFGTSQAVTMSNIATMHDAFIMGSNHPTFAKWNAFGRMLPPLNSAFKSWLRRWQEFAARVRALKLRGNA